MPHIKIEETEGKITLFKDGRVFAYAPNMTNARAIKVACEDWWLRSKKERDDDY